MDVLIDELSKDETIFAPTEPRKLKQDTKSYQANRARRSLLHYKEHTHKALKISEIEDIIKNGPNMAQTWP